MHMNQCPRAALSSRTKPSSSRLSQATSMRAVGSILALCGLALHSLPALSLSPEDLFSRLSPSIWFVYGVDQTERRTSQGSGVVIGPQRVVTNCHVVRGADTVFLRKENVIYVAKIEFRDPSRDLCQLQVANLNAPAVPL